MKKFYKDKIMIEYIKQLPDGLSLSYLIFKLLDNVSEENQNTGLWYLINDGEFFNRDSTESPDGKIVSYIGFRNDMAVQKLFPHICITSKFSKKRNHLIYFNGNDLIISDRDSIENFYKEIEDSFKEQDLTKLILTIGKDPFKMNEWLTVLLKEEHHKFKENIFTLKLRDIK